MYFGPDHEQEKRRWNELQTQRKQRSRTRLALYPTRDPDNENDAAPMVAPIDSWMITKMDSYTHVNGYLQWVDREAEKALETLHKETERAGGGV